MRYYPGNVLLLLALLFGCGCTRHVADITINVIMPPSTPANTTIYLTGNHPLLGNWIPKSMVVEEINDSLRSITFSMPRGYNLEFKISRGSWDTQAMYRAGEVPDNISVRVTQDTVITLRPVGWKDTYDNSSGGIVGDVEYHRGLSGAGLNYARDIIVWLPPSYRTDKARRYPVLYMHDGQNIIDPATSFIGYDWHVDEVSDSLISAGKMKEIIIVGINNSPDRNEEYGDTELAHAYMNFIIKNLKPFIDSTYRTLTDRQNSATIGSSMGGLISFLIVWHYPDIFSMAGCLSPAFYGGIVDAVIDSKGGDKDLSVYIDNGGVGLDAELQPGCDRMRAALARIGFSEGRNLLWYQDLHAQHNERAWAARLWRPLLFFFGQ